jgi:hypothetical protein
MNRALFLFVPLASILTLHVSVNRAKPLDFDETIVSKTALQPHLPSLWNILASGQSPHPPLNFLAVRAAYAAFGVSDFSTRLPTTLGFTLMGICLFFFVEKRSNPAYGAVAMLLPILSMARVYAMEAKPYASLLGWTGIALLCWQNAQPGSPRRAVALLGLGLALASATSSHFFGALLAVPLLAGEAVRWWGRRRIDWPMLASISLNYWPLLFFIPILKAGRAVHGTHPWQTSLTLGFIPRSFDLLLMDAAAPLLFCVLWAGTFRPARPDTRRLPADELAAAAILALLPVVAFCGLRLAGIHVIEEKYLIAMVVGVSILFSWSLYALAGRSLLLGTVLAATLLFWCCRDFLRELHGAQQERFEVVNFRPPAPDLPILIDTPRFATVERYATPEISNRIFYLIDPQARLKYIGTDALDQSFLLNPGFFGKHVQPAQAFEAAHREFLLYERLPETSWMLRKYTDQGARIQLLKTTPSDRWYLIQTSSVLTMRSAFR